MGDINSSKFSTVEIYDNGIAIGMKLGPNTTQNIYIKNDDVRKILNEFITSSSRSSSNTSSSVTYNDNNSYESYIANKSSRSSDNGIEDAVY